MGKLSPSGPKGPSEAELKAQRERQEQLEQERKESQQESDRLRRERISSQRAARRGLTGRRSLITGSELGEKDKLG